MIINYGFPDCVMGKGEEVSEYLEEEAGTVSASADTAFPIQINSY